MHRSIFISLPVTDLEAPMAFYAALGAMWMDASAMPAPEQERTAQEQ